VGQNRQWQEVLAVNSLSRGGGEWVGGFWWNDRQRNYPVTGMKRVCSREPMSFVSAASVICSKMRNASQ